MTQSLHWNSVTRDYGNGEGIREVTIEVKAGEFFVVLGPSGSGKSTLLRTASGFERPDEGSVWVGLTDVTTTPPERRPTAMVFQSHALWPHMTVAENVGFAMKLRGWRGEKKSRRVDELLELVRLGGAGNRHPRQLSGGQRQRVALARALAADPEVLLLDEPLSSLDVRLREQLRAELVDLQQRIGITMVYVTHDQEDAAVLADRIGLLSDGRVVQVGSPEDVYERPETSFVARFCGRALLLPATGVRHGEALTACLLGGDEIETIGGNPNGKFVAVRAEAIVVSDTQTKNSIRATVVSSKYIDGRLATQFATNHGEVTLELPLPGLQVGASCFLVVPAGRAWLVA